MPDRRESAMLDCQDGDKEGDSNCKHCQASGDKQPYWGIQLDQDLLETIVGLYPEWFQGCDMSGAAQGEPVPLARPHPAAQHRPARADARQRALDRNKESLKVKLMLRRPINQLVDQGILPSLKSPPAFHEQRQKLERAKMGDFLKHKIQKRPDKQELIQQHILEDTSVDPSLQDKQRQLKRARLADGLNDKISQRPGPLELVKVNILQADEILSQAVREGSLPFKSTCDTPSPNMRISLDDDSGSDGVFSPSPPYDFSEHSQGSSLPSLEASEPSPNPNQGSPCSGRTSFSMSPPSSVSSPLSVPPSVVSPHEQVAEFMLGSLQLQHCGRADAKNRKKTKPKTQPKARTIKFHEYKGPPNAQKTVAAPASSMTESSYDLLLQQQQLFLQWQLEWQQKYPQVVLQAAQKTNGDQMGQANPTSSSTCTQLFESPESPQKLLSKIEDLKVSDLKAELKKRNLPVSGSKPLLIERLKSYAELPQNMTNSHSLLSTSDCVTTANTTLPMNVQGILLDSLPNAFTDQNEEDEPPLTPIKVEMPLINELDTGDAYQELLSMSHDTGASVDDLDMRTTCDEVDMSESTSASFSNEDIVQLQQRCIEKLQKELERSQMQLHRTIVGNKPQVTVTTTSAAPTTTFMAVTYSNTTVTSTSTSSKAPAVCSPEVTEVESAENKATQRQILHQYIQQRLQQQQLQIQKQKLEQETLKQNNSLSNSQQPPSSSNANSTLTALLESRPMNSRQMNHTTTKAVASYPSTIMTTQVFECKKEIDSSPMKAYPGVIPILSPEEEASKMAVLSMPKGIANNRTSSLPSFSALIPNKPAPTRSNTDPQFLLAKPPPDYNEATRQLNKVKQNRVSPNMVETNRRPHKKQKSSVKCQAVDDVLEILIKNGELPPSAAQEPPTPTTPTTPKSNLPPHSMFPNTNEDTLFSVVNNTPIMSTTNSTPHLKDTSPDLHGTSLQSVLELTPPSSAGFGDGSSHVTTPLDFEFHLDMDDIEAMDLELDTGHHQVTGASDPPMPIHYSKTNLKGDGGFGVHQAVSLANSIVDLHDRVMDRNIDMDLFEWLEVQEEPSNSSSFHHPSYSISNDCDPLLSNIVNGHESLDLFPNDEIDFKTGHNLNLLQWDKADFAT